MTESAPRWGAVDLVVAFVVAQLASALGFALFALHVGIRLVDDLVALRSGQAFEEVEDEIVMEATNA